MAWANTKDHNRSGGCCITAVLRRAAVCQTPFHDACRMPSVFSSLQHAVAPEESVMQLQLPTGGRRFRTCAIVGSSGSLLEDRFGAQIDRHDIVLRFNNAPTKGFEPIVGSKTSVRLLNSHAASAILQQCGAVTASGECTAAANASAQCCPQEPVLLNTGRKKIAECYRRVCSTAAFNAKTWLYHASSLVRASQELASPRSLMSGIYGLAIALLLCTEQVDLYGIALRTNQSHSATALRSSARYHYYDECDRFDSDALGATTDAIADMSHFSQQNARWAAARIRLVAPTRSRPEWTSPGERRAHAPSERCPNRNGVAEITALLEKAATTKRDIGCCSASAEFGMARRCAALADRGHCERVSYVCVVACEQCRVCPATSGTQLYEAYMKLFASMKHPPSPHWYPGLASRRNRSGALQDVQVYSLNRSAPAATKGRPRRRARPH